MNRSYLQSNLLKKDLDKLKEIRNNSIEELFNEELRDKFFEECTHTRDDKGFGATILRKVDLAPHDLFEWFKRNVR